MKTLIEGIPLEYTNIYRDIQEAGVLTYDDGKQQRNESKHKATCLMNKNFSKLVKNIEPSNNK